MIREYHRHSPEAPNQRAHQFSLALLDGWRICGVVMVCRPASRHLDDGTRLEVARLCTDGTHNACSRLYAAAFRETLRRGYVRLGTYTLSSESGASLRAAGFTRLHSRKARSWNTPSRPRSERTPPDESRIYWERAAQTKRRGPC